MRCSQCNKFVSYDEPRAEVEGVEINGTTLKSDVTMYLPCSDCSTDIASTCMSVEAEIEHVCKDEAPVLEDWKEDDDEDQFEVESDGDPECSDRFETKDRHGKPIKNPRYQKHYYGFSQSVEVKCKRCGEVFSIELNDEQPASSFEEC